MNGEIAGLSRNLVYHIAGRSSIGCRRPAPVVGAPSVFAGVRWAGSVRQLLHVKGGTQIVAVHYQDRDGRVIVEREEVVAQVPGGTTLCGVSADGQRILVAKPVKRASLAPDGIRILLNGVESLSGGPR